MRTDISQEEGRVMIRLQGRFTFDAHFAFMAAVETAIRRAPGEIQVNLAGIEHMDTAGLGMLLLLKEKARSAGKSVSLVECREQVRAMIGFASAKALFGLAPPIGLAA